MNVGILIVVCLHTLLTLHYYVGVGHGWYIKFWFHSHPWTINFSAIVIIYHTHGTFNVPITLLTNTLYLDAHAYVEDIYLNESIKKLQDSSKK